MTPNTPHNARWVGQMPTNFFFKPLVLALAELMVLMLGLTDMPVIGPAIAPRAHAQDPITVKPFCHPTPGQSLIIQNVCSYINPPQSLNSFITDTPPWEDIQQFETDSVKEFLAMYGLPASDASLIYQYGRADLRTMVRSHMLANLLHIASYGPANAHEQALYNWLSTQMQLFEKTFFTVAVQEKNRWLSNPCTWSPDPDIAQAYGLHYSGDKFCNNNNSLQGLYNIAQNVPSIDYFLAFAMKQVYGSALGDSVGSKIQAVMSTNLAEMAGIAAAGGVVGAGATAGVVAGAAGAIFPFSAGMAGAAGGLDALGSLGLALGGPAAIILVFVLIGILATWEVLNEQTTLQGLAYLDQDLHAVTAAPFPLVIYAGAPQFVPNATGTAQPTGLYKLTSVITALTLPEYSSSATLPTHQLTDVNFYVTPSNTYNNSLTYTDSAGSAWSAQTYGGWFVRKCLTNCGTLFTDSITPTLEVVDASGTAWNASRNGATAFTLTRKKTVLGLNACPANQGTPNPQNCSSYFTTAVPYKDGNGNPGTFSLVLNPTFVSGTNAFFSQGVPGSFTITASGSPLPTISALSSLPAGFSLNPSAGTATLSYNGALTAAGHYTITVGAQNGTSTQQTINITLNEATPQFTSPITAPFTKGVPGSFTVQVTGNPPPKITVGTPHFPPIDLDFVDNGNGTATISGTIPLNASYCSGASCNISGLINATNSAGVGGSSAQQNLTLSVGSAVLPFLVPPTSFVFNAGVPNIAVIQATGPTRGAISNVCNALPSWLTFTDNGNNTATLSGIPPVAATTVGLHVIVSPPGTPPDFNCGSGGGSNYSINVVIKPAFTSPNSATFTVGTQGSFTITNVPSSLTTLKSGVLPQGLTFNPNFAQAKITGTPAAGTAGAYPLQFTMEGSTPPAVQNFTLVANERATFPGPYTTDFTVNQPSSFVIPTNGYPRSPIAGQQGMNIVVIPAIFGSLPPGINLVQNLNALGGGTGEWLLTGTPTQIGQYNVELVVSNNVGTPSGQGFTINVVPAAPLKTTPIITWMPPAAITYGSALSGVQLNATATIPGTFTYAPPAGTVLSIGSQTLNATFTPSDTAHYNTAIASTSISVNPAPPTASGVNLIVTKTLSRVNGNVVALIRISNTGGTPATSVTLTTLQIGSTKGTPLPQSLGILGPGASAEATVTFPGSVGAAGAASSLTLGGTYDGGAFSANSRITLP